MGLHAEQRARGLVEQAASRHGNGLVLSTSFGIHSAAMLHLVTRVVPDVPVIWVDTGFRSAVCTSHDRRQKERSMSEAIHLTKLDFEDQVLSSTKPVLVDFWADWCAPCHRVAPVLDELAERYADQVAVYKVDVDQEPELAREYAIRSIPTFLFVREGEVVDRLSGAHPEARFVERIEPLLEKTM